MDTNEHGISGKKRRKGVKEVTYKCEIVKKARIKWEEYVNHRGTKVEKIQPGRECRCKKKCLNKVPDEIKLEVFSKFRDFNTKDEQDTYLQNLIIPVPIQRRRPVQKDNIQRKTHDSAFKYSLVTSSGKIDICKDGFLKIHGITGNRVRRITGLLVTGKSPKDLRGKHTPGIAKPAHVIAKIKEHIESFPVKKGHYTTREYAYLSERLNVKIMHELFCSKYPNLSISYKFYLKIFKEYDLSFGRPQVDTCTTCEGLNIKLKSNVLNDSAKRVAAAEKMVHLRRAKKFYNQMKSVAELCQKDLTVDGICIDYMQNLMLPVVPIQDTFYLHQLTVNIFNIHHLKTGKSMLYMYHEGLGKKGPNEVCSFIVNAVMKEKLVSEDVKHFHIFSDGCPGQNKNHTTIRMCSAFVAMGRFDTVEQYFPIRGHSYMPCDRDFAVIKRKLKKIDRIYKPKQYLELILESSSKNNFSVYFIESDNSVIKDFKGWWLKYYKRTGLSLETASRNIPRDQKQPFAVSSFNHFSYSSATKGYVVARDFILGLNQHTFKLSINNEVPVFPSQEAYPDVKIPIKDKKMKSLKKFQGVVEDDEVSGVREFYNEIFQWPTTVATDNDDD